MKPKGISIGFISDLHIGSVTSPWPTGLSYRSSRLQTYLYEEFCRHLEVLSKCYSVVLMGDLTHGSNVLRRGRFTVTPDLEVQVNAAIEVLRPLKGKTKILGVRGSGYHTSSDYDLEKVIVEELGGTWMGRFAAVQFGNFETKFLLIHDASHSMIYKMTPLERDRRELDISISRGKFPFHPDVWVFGHVHKASAYCENFQNSTRWTVTLPCWQAWWPEWKGTSKVIGAKMPDLGTGIIELEEDRIFPRFIFLDHRRVSELTVEVIRG
ncbi:MAG: hypothetical protein QXT73_00405 [Candidatus Methanomethylicaceae archaeon]